MNVRRWLFFALALGLGSWVAAPASATAAGVIAAPAVEVDASELGTMPARMVAEVTASASQAVEDAGLPEAEVRVTFVEVDPMTVERGVRVWLRTDEATVLDPRGDPRGRLLTSCTACSDAELAGLAIEAVLEATELHEDLVDASRVAAAAPAPAPAVVPPPVTPPDDPPRRTPGPLRPLGWTGIAVAGLGASAMITGAVLASRAPRPFPGELRMDELRDLRPAGHAVLGVGATLVTTGVVMVVVERRRVRTRQRSRLGAWIPRPAW